MGSLYIYYLATWSMVSALLISGYSIFMHLKNFQKPSFQVLILRILIMIPVYAIMTWFSIRYPENYLVFNTFRDM